MITPRLASIPESKRLILATESQADNQGGQGYRECFSSTCGAIARYWGRVVSDDEYNRIRRRFGDTTNPQAQLLALRSLGLLASFVSNGSPLLLRQEIAAGRPVAVGWIHKGPLVAPVGTGHWSAAVGYNLSSVRMMDPNGEADMAGGGYVSVGRGWEGWYSWKNWRRRWEVRETSDGWVHSPGNGWALLVRDPGERGAIAAA
jgi:hypothetical protein